MLFLLLCLDTVGGTSDWNQSGTHHTSGPPLLTRWNPNPAGVLAMEAILLSREFAPPPQWAPGLHLHHTAVLKHCSSLPHLTGG